MTALFFGLAACAIPSAAQRTVLQLDPAATTISFSLEAALHNVHGIFRAKPSQVEFDSASGLISGEILVDAKSGQSGNGMRDRKMHAEILESSSYPEISFHPDRINGTVTSQGKSVVTVHGIFRIHGADREINVPAQVEISGDRCSVTAHFSIPYAKWGMKNPSTLFLKASDSVEIDVSAVGKLTNRTANSAQ